MIRRLLPYCVIAGFLVPTPPAFAAKGYSKLNEMSLERWGLLRETEKYQMNIAEKYLRAAERSNKTDDWKIAAAEYEKFLTLYEASEGAPYAQLMWSHCQVGTKKLNTAIKDGYQSVIDYWPDSPEAVAAAYLIGKTYKSMGDLPQAKQAYRTVITKHADEMVAILARLDLADVARIEQNRPERIAVLKDLVFNAKREGDAGRQIVDASISLAFMLFEDGAFVEGKNVLATGYQEPTLCGQVLASLVYGRPNGVPGVVSKLVGTADTKERGVKLADAAIAYVREQQSAAPKDDQGARDKQLTYYIADLHGVAGRPEEAEKIYAGLLKSYPGDDGVLVQYAGWLKSRNRRDEARLAYGKMKDQISGQSHIARSYRPGEESRPLLAVPIYEDLIVRDPKGATGWQLQLAHSYREGGKYKEAIAAYQQTEINGECLRLMASCYRQLKQYREAIGLYTQIIGAYESEAPSALLQIARTHAEAGSTETAIATFQQVCKKYPTYREAAEAHQTLNNVYKITVTLGGTKDE